MPFYAQLNAEGCVHTVCELKDDIGHSENMIPITSADERLLGKWWDNMLGFYDRIVMLDGPTHLTAGEVGKFFLSWTPNCVLSPFLIECKGKVIEVPVGETLDFSADEPGTYVIRTINPNVQNAEVEVVVE